MGFGKEACLGEILSWPSTSGGGVVHMPEAYGSLCDYGDSPKVLAALMYLFEEVHRAYSGKEGKQMPATVGWPLLWAVWLVTDAQLEAEALVKSWKKT